MWLILWQENMGIGTGKNWRQSFNRIKKELLYKKYLSFPGKAIFIRIGRYQKEQIGRCLPARSPGFCTDHSE